MTIFEECRATLRAPHQVFGSQRILWFASSPGCFGLQYSEQRAASGLESTVARRCGSRVRRPTGAMPERPDSGSFHSPRRGPILRRRDPTAVLVHYSTWSRSTRSRYRSPTTLECSRHSCRGDAMSRCIDEFCEGASRAVRAAPLERTSSCPRTTWWLTFELSRRRHVGAESEGNVPTCSSQFISSSRVRWRRMVRYDPRHCEP